MNIEEIKKIYPPRENGKFDWCYDDYRPLLESFGYDILCQEDEDDYQGDSFVLYHDKQNNKYGFLVFGWGSCSGCDSLQQCKTYKEILELRNNLMHDIKWFNNSEKLIEYLSDEETRILSYYGRSSTFIEFKENVIKLLGNKNEQND